MDEPCRRVALCAGFQARTDADPANASQDEIDTEEKPENVEARNRPVRKDHKAEKERDHTGQDHPDSGRPLLHAKGQDDPHDARGDKSDPLRC
jgi:hypothetical protein